MKVSFIIAKDDGQHSALHQLSQSRLFPPVALAPMLRLVEKQADIQVLDERLGWVRHGKMADIVVIFINGYNQQRAKELAKKYQMRGCFVVLTGPAVSRDSLLDNNYANCLFIGSGDACMEEFLRDYSSASVSPFYCHEGRQQGEAAISMTFGGFTLSIAS